MKETKFQQSMSFGFYKCWWGMGLVTGITTYGFLVMSYLLLYGRVLSQKTLSIAIPICIVAGLLVGFTKKREFQRKEKLTTQTE